MKVRQIVTCFELAMQGGVRLSLRLFLKEFLRRLYSNEQVYGFHTDLTRDFQPYQAEIPIIIREFSEKDIPHLLDPGRAGIDETEFRHVIISRWLIEAHLPTCYVAVAQDGTPCCMCWLVRPEDNHRLQACFGEGYYRLKQGEVLLENILTHPNFRRKSLMKHVLVALRRKAVEMGAQRSVGFISKDNLPSIAGARATGSKPFTLQTTRWRLFRRRGSGEDLHSDNKTT
jgi:Acetyltransferase (GNAT) family